VCHIEYATCLARGQILNLLYSFVYLKEYDIIFSETPKHTKMYLLKQEEQPITNTKIVLAGSPKFDAIYYNDFQPPASEYRHTVLYTPRWNLTDGTSSFLALKDTFFKMAKEHPDVEFIFRPHPLMEKTYLENDASAIAWKEFIGQFKIYKNAVIDEKPDYIETFKKATVLLSDFSSFLAEFLLTGKPVVYFHKKYILNSFGEYIAQGFYWCYDEKETSDTIRDLIQGNDPKKETRKEVIQNGFYFGGQTAAREIRDCLLRDYNGEEIAYHEKP
jgi:CDP-glycerol glycerophosphotransferase (TagB/SpsB family)